MCMCVCACVHAYLHECILICAHTCARMLIRVCTCVRAETSRWVLQRVHRGGHGRRATNQQAFDEYRRQLPQMHKPIALDDCWYPGSKDLENQVTIYYATLYGPDKVRGGSWTKPEQWPPVQQ